MRYLGGKVWDTKPLIQNQYLSIYWAMGWNAESPGGKLFIVLYLLLPIFLEHWASLTVLLANTTWHWVKREIYEMLELLKLVTKQCSINSTGNLTRSGALSLSHHKLLHGQHLWIWVKKHAWGVGVTEANCFLTLKSRSVWPYLTYFIFFEWDTIIGCNLWLVL